MSKRFITGEVIITFPILIQGDKKIDLREFLQKKSWSYNYNKNWDKNTNIEQIDVVTKMYKITDAEKNLNEIVQIYCQMIKNYGIKVDQSLSVLFNYSINTLLKLPNISNDVELSLNDINMLIECLHIIMLHNNKLISLDNSITYDLDIKGFNGNLINSKVVSSMVENIKSGQITDVINSLDIKNISNGETFGNSISLDRGYSLELKSIMNTKTSEDEIKSYIPKLFNHFEECLNKINDYIYSHDMDGTSSENILKKWKDKFIKSKNKEQYNSKESINILRDENISVDTEHEDIPDYHALKSEYAPPNVVYYENKISNVMNNININSHPNKITQTIKQINSIVTDIKTDWKLYIKVLEGLNFKTILQMVKELNPGSKITKKEIHAFALNYQKDLPDRIKQDKEKKDKDMKSFRDWLVNDVKIKIDEIKQHAIYMSGVVNKIETIFPDSEVSLDDDRTSITISSPKNILNIAKFTWPIDDSGKLTIKSIKMRSNMNEFYLNGINIFLSSDMKGGSINMDEKKISNGIIKETDHLIMTSVDLSNVQMNDIVNIETSSLTRMINCKISNSIIELAPGSSIINTSFSKCTIVIRGNSKSIGYELPNIVNIKLSECKIHCNKKYEKEIRDKIESGDWFKPSEDYEITPDVS